MPSKYVIRDFSAGKTYHIFNCGVEKRKIFLDEMDYRKFIRCLSMYLLDPEEVKKRLVDFPARSLQKNVHDRVDLYTYSLMPNHIHLQVKPKDSEVIPKLMGQVSNAYTSYFNKKYNRMGSLFQGRYKAAEIDNDALNIHVHRYIQINAPVAGLVKHPKDYKWCSYGEYAGLDDLGICKVEGILSRFANFKAYERFLLDQIDYGKNLKRIEKTLMER